MKFIPYIKFVLLILCVIAFIAGVATYDSANPKVVTGGLDFLFTWSFAMIVITIVSALMMPLFGILQNPKSAVRSLIGLGIIVVMFLVAYAMADTTPITLASGEVRDDLFELKFSDMALYSTYFAFAGVILTIVGTEIYKIFK